MTVKVQFVKSNGVKLVQNFAGCTDIEDGKAKCRSIFPGCVIKKAEEFEEKKK